MNKKTKITIAVVIFGILLSALSGCGGARNIKTDKISIVTTIFPVYDWVKEISGDRDNIEIILLLDNGIDLHSYQPTVDDIANIRESDLFIYVGGNSDAWADNVADKMNGGKSLNLVDLLGDRAKEEEVVAGMEAEEEEKVKGEDVEIDEHIWLSLKNASYLCDKIGKEISEIDGNNSDEYISNAKKYIEKLNKLDFEYDEITKNAKRKTLLFGDRFPFRYMTDDYGLEYYAAFAGCSAETEASFETIAFLAEKVNELSLPYVLALTESDGKIAQTIIDSTADKNQKIERMNSLQSITAKEIEEDGISYLGVMTDNLEVLKTVLY